MGKPVSEEEVLGRIDFDGANGCWNWTGTLTQGYGCLTFRRRNWMTHRFVYENFCEEVPEGLVLDHLCHNRACCNPDHMEVVTQEENLRRKLPRVSKKSLYPRVKHPKSRFYLQIVAAMKDRYGEAWQERWPDYVPFTVDGKQREPAAEPSAAPGREG